MIYAQNNWTQKKHWPIISRFIGTAGIREDISVRNYQRDCRFYIYDNTFQAVDRINAVRYLKQCYEEGYTKDIDFTTSQPNMYKRRHSTPTFMTYE
jgi:hypothetical protein